MAKFREARQYSAKNLIFYPSVIADFLSYKGNPTTGIYTLPISTESTGRCVIVQGGNNIAYNVGSNKILYNAFITTSNAPIDTFDIYVNNEMVFNYNTNNFLTYVPASTVGNAYRLKMQSVQRPIDGAFQPGLVYEKIGNWNDIRNNYDNQAVVLTGYTAWKDVGEINRVRVDANVYSISDCFGRRTYKANGEYDKTSGSNQSTEGGYIIVRQLVQFSSKSGGIYNGAVWYDLYRKMGADIIVFDKSADDKTGKEVDTFNSNSILTIIFPSKKDIPKLGNSIAIPFVIDDENAAKTDDIDDFPDYEKPGVPDNETGGGDGLGDNESDKMDNPENPKLSPIAAGNNLYAMTINELEQTFNFLWDGHNKDIAGVTLSEANIIDTLCNCFYMPFDILSHDSAHCIEATVTAGGYASEVNSKAIISGYNKRFNFGDIEIEEYYGSYLDYSPFTTVSIYLPYIGFKQLDVSKCMGKKINVTYSVDFSQGIVTAYISYYYDGNKQVFAEFSGQIGIPIKVTGKNTTAAENAVKDAAFAVGGFALAAISVLAVPATGGTSLIGTAGAVGAGLNAIGKTVNAMTVQPDSISVGNAGAENWLLSPQGCYVHIQRPRTATPENFKDTNGWATRYTGTISEFTGYLECSTVINTVSATAEEKNQITNLLKQGVYI